MSTATTNLGISYIASNQTAKEVTANTAFDGFDGALGSHLATAMSDANYTLNLSASPNEALGYLTYTFTGTLTADRNVITPTNKKMYAVLNSTTGGFNLTLKTSGGTGIIVPNGVTRYTMLYCDGTNVVALGKIPNQVLNITGAKTLEAYEQSVYCDATSAAFTVTIPSAASTNKGVRLLIKKTDSSGNAITLSGVSAEITSLGTQYKYVEYESDGSAWWVRANN